MKLRTT